MQELEDEPEDVQNARPVEEEVKKGEIDEVYEKKGDVSLKSKESLPRHCCKKDKPAIQKVDCCEVKRQRAAVAQQKTVTMYVHEEPCKLVKQKIIPRHCMSKEEYIDFLAAPSKKCQDTCAKKHVTRRVCSVPPRIEELARPAKRRLMLTLEERGMMLPPEMLNNLIELLEGETALTPEQAENLVRDKANSKKMAKKKKHRSKCSDKTKEPLAAGDPSLDLEVANCQYSIAQRFVKSIFSWKCSIPRDDYQDIFDVILERLSISLEYTPIGNEDRKSQQMRILADAFACWISGVLIQVSEKHKAELEEECLKRRLEAEQLEAMAMYEMETTEEEDDIAGSGDFDDDDEDEEDKQLTEAASLAKTLEEADMTAEQSDVTLAVESSTQYEEEDIEAKVSEMDEELLMAAKSRTTMGADESEDETKVSEIGDDETVPIEAADSGIQTEHDMLDAVTEMTAEESAMSAAKSREQLELEKIASRMCGTETDLPFITFAKVFDTLYCMIECEAENTLDDTMDNRIHRAIYEKFEAVIKREDPALLTERMKDVVDVTTGKIAKWLRRTLNAQQIKFLDENPAVVESREVRDWSKWIANVADMAEDWTSWINKVTDEAKCMKRAGNMTRGAWQDWTSKFESNALLWRRTYLEAVHQEHHNTMMLCDRNVQKTGMKKNPQYSEMTIKNTNFDSVSKM